MRTGRGAMWSRAELQPNSAYSPVKSGSESCSSGIRPSASLNKTEQNNKVRLHCAFSFDPPRAKKHHTDRLPAPNMTFRQGARAPPEDRTRPAALARPDATFRPPGTSASARGRSRLPAGPVALRRSGFIAAPTTNR